MAERSPQTHRAGAVPASTPAGEATPDLQTLLGAAVARLAEASGCTHVAAWGRRPSGEAFVMAATAEAAGPHEPDAELLAALQVLVRPTDLGGAGLEPKLARRAEAAGFAAATALCQGDESTPVLLVGGPADPSGRVRPATLAALGAAAARLAGPLEDARAAARLGALGQEVRRIDALASLGQLVSEVVHEVRNPLVSVKTFLQLLPDRIDDPEFRNQFLEVVGEEVRRIERLLELVLEQARPESRPAAGGEESVDPGPVLDSVVRLLTHRAQERGVVLHAESGAAAPVPMSRDALHQVMLNLAMNAVDATPSGGSVRLVAVEAEGAVRIACDDEGPGIPEALRDQVFEPFFSTKHDRPGGLGLAIARRMVLESGGTIQAEPRHPTGTRFALAWRR